MTGVRVTFVLTKRQAVALLRSELSVGYGVRRSLDLKEAEQRLMEATEKAYEAAEGRQIAEQEVP